MIRSLGFSVAFCFLSGPAWAAGGSTLTLPIIVNFLVLAGAIIYFARKPVKETFASRHEEMKKAVDDAEELRLQVENMVKEYEARLSGLSEDVNRILEEARSDGEKERQAILARAEVSAEEIRKDVLRRSEREMERLKKKLEREVMAQAIERATSQLRKRMTEKDHRAFTAELISHLEESDGPRP